MAAIESCIFHAWLDAAHFYYGNGDEGMYNRMIKAFDMNSFAVSNGFSSGLRGCPRGFAAIEDRFDSSEEALLCWCTDSLKYGAKAAANDKGVAFVLTLGRLLYAVKTDTGYFVHSVPVWNITEVSVSKRRMFSKPVIIITMIDGELRFSCRSPEITSKLYGGTMEALRNQL